MSLYQARPSVDPLERQRIENENRRTRNIERAKRILHPKTRIMGVDTNALAQQVADRQEQERQEAERKMFYDDLTVRHAKVATEAHNQQALARKREHQKLEYFRIQQVKEKRARQQAEIQRQTQPELDTDFLKFHGEDLEAANRKKLQQSQMKDWLSQQIDNLRLKENREAQEQADYDAMQQRILEMKNNHEAEAQKNRAKELKQISLQNQQIAAEKKAREKAAARLNARHNEQELHNTLSSDLMTETVRSRVMGGARACTDNLPYHFKGFSTSQRQHILDVQQQQINELNAKRERERQEEQAYHDQQESIRRQILLAERRQMQQKRQERASLNQTRSLQAKDAALRRNYLDNVVYQNPVQEDFFGQFGTSCR
jgi:hypothetical protein